MKQLLSDLLVKATEFLKQLSANSTASATVKPSEPPRSHSSVNLNLQTQGQTAPYSVESNSEQSESVVDEPVVASTIPEAQAVVETESVVEAEVVTESVQAEPEAVVEAEVVAEPVQAEPEAVVEAEVVAEPVQVEPAPVVEVSAPSVDSHNTSASAEAVPEDSSLRRHYLTQRQSDLLAELGDEPSDSTLKRHYQQLLAAKIAELDV